MTSQPHPPPRKVFQKKFFIIKNKSGRGGRVVIVPFYLPHPALRREQVSTIRLIKRKFFSTLSERQKQASLCCSARSKFSPVLTQKILKECKQTAASILKVQQIKKSPPPSYKNAYSTADIYVRDNFGLPVQKKGVTQPSWVIKRREFLKKLSVQDRNLLLTGDPYFQFDPIVYDCIFFLPFNVTPPLLQQQLGYLNPDVVEISDSDQSDSESSDLTEESDSEPLTVESDSNNSQIESDSENSTIKSDSNVTLVPDSASDPEPDNPNATLQTDSSFEFFTPPCTPARPKAAQTPPTPTAMAAASLTPPKTRSGRLYNVLKTPPTDPPSTSGQSSSFFSRAGQAVSRMLEGPPPSQPQPRSRPGPKPKPKKQDGGNKNR